VAARDGEGRDSTGFAEAIRADIERFGKAARDGGIKAN
jgi:hypothetical protein